ncbi:MAG: deoxyguanosinetriphosphate triphosphohydrolase [Gammaproteobacteria bacterium]|nr:deoxyguanosinetriphosphate triphosphohydrolase [Gammaproteobacteria bacterium]MBU1733314.1 deoxyguanosinetriphosphate triphosphohydrolase [Gammaproteobacteria bacterium]MBU1892362.1 deoxyguanosinetriphosphate triphosphohydrolase [Gammaproteobacteria bacterium]
MSALAPYAADSAHTRGRQQHEPTPPGRSDFERDRDRIIHSTAFRRLEYKTQVFVNHEGDLFRTRLTHSLEVAQIGRTIARNLQLNEVLVEAIALAHDLGHTPFGHAGQDELNDCMKEHGGFEHNIQSLRVVDLLEERYAEFDGLNLCFETREGILKHCSLPNARMLGDVGERFLLDQRPSLEAQVSNLADEIAYNNHDVDDGLRSGLITLEQLSKTSLFARHLAMAQEKHAGLDGRRLIHETVRRMINTLVMDLIEQSTSNIRAAAPASLDDVRRAPPLIAFSPALANEQRELKQFLRKHLYRHYLVNRVSMKTRRIVRELFSAFFETPSLLPPQYQEKAHTDNARTIADYIAGMTDRYAYREHRRLFAIEEI